MFGSPMRKALIRSFDPMLTTFGGSVEASVGKRADRDTVIMFMGWLHFSMGYLAQRRRLGAGDFMPLLDAAAAAVRRVAPDHGLPVSFIADTKAAVQTALGELRAGQHVLEWLPTYYRSQTVAVDEAIFMSAIGREVTAVMAS